MLASSPFFKSTPLSIPKRHFIDVGAMGDSGFCALAIALIDNSLNAPNTNKQVLKRLLDQHSHYYPSVPTHRLQTPVERLQKMVATPSLMATTIEQFAFILRQIAVDEWHKKTVIYRSAFVSKSEEVSASTMRKQGTFMDDNAIAALANALDIPIILRVVAPGKELPAKYQYNKSSRASDVLIRLSHQHYTVAVIQVERFVKAIEAVVREAIQVNNPSIIHFESDRADSLLKIRENDARLAEDFDKNTTCLSKLLESGELNKNDLLAIYIAGITECDSLQNSVQYVGIEHGNKKFFQAVLNHAGRSILMPNTPLGHCYEEQVVKELVHGISRAISMGYLSADVIDEHLDSRQKQNSAP